MKRNSDQIFDALIETGATEQKPPDYAAIIEKKMNEQMKAISDKLESKLDEIRKSVTEITAKDSIEQEDHDAPDQSTDQEEQEENKNEF